MCKIYDTIAYFANTLPIARVALSLPLIGLARLPVGPTGGKAWLFRMMCQASTPRLGMQVSSRRFWPMLGAPPSYSPRTRPVAGMQAARVEQSGKAWCRGIVERELPNGSSHSLLNPRISRGMLDGLIGQ